MRNGTTAARSFTRVGLLTLLPVVGCGGGGAEVTGKVTLNGEPLKAGKVTFYDPDRPGRNVIADIKPDGTYHVFACPYGQVRVTVQPLPPRAEAGAARPVRGHVPGARTGPEPAPKRPAATIPAVNRKYTDPATTDLLCPVTSRTQTVDIDLKP